MTKTRIKKAANSGQFLKGRSGNAGGRPVAIPRTQASALQVFVDTTLSFNDHGMTREISLQVLLQNQTLKRALAGDPGDSRVVVKWITERDDWERKHALKTPAPSITRRFSPDPDNADAALLLLQIATLNPLQEQSNMVRMPLRIKTWAAQAALVRRRGGARLTANERDSIQRCTTDSETLRWPRGTDK